MMMENLVEWRLAGETEVLGENPQRHFVHHKSHLTRPGIEPGKPATNRLSYGAAHVAGYLLFLYDYVQNFTVTGACSLLQSLVWLTLVLAVLISQPLQLNDSDPLHHVWTRPCLMTSNPSHPGHFFSLWGRKRRSEAIYSSPRISLFEHNNVRMWSRGNFCPSKIASFVIQTTSRAYT
jgi:hypothetical protein